MCKHGRPQDPSDLGLAWLRWTDVCTSRIILVKSPRNISHKTRVNSPVERNSFRDIPVLYVNSFNATDDGGRSKCQHS